jgi:hypothetical protein
MDFLLPVFKKDLLRLRGLLICWILLLGVQVFLGIAGIELAAKNPKLTMRLSMLAEFIVFLRGTMIVIIIPLFVQSDPVVGSTAFWFTRPIGRKQLLITKLCFFACFLLFLPMFVEWIIFAVNGFSAKYLLLSIPEIIVHKSLFLLPFFLLAAITSKFSRYAVVGISVPAVLIVVSIIGSIVFSFLPETKHVSLYFHDVKEPKIETLSMSAVLVICCAAVLWGYAVLIYQYLSRRTVKTVLLTAAGLVLLIPIYPLWGIDLLKQDFKTRSAVTPDMVMVKIKTDNIRTSPNYDRDENDKKERRIYADSDISCACPGEFVKLTKLVPGIEYPNDNKLQSYYFSQRFGSTINRAQRMNYIQAALTCSKIINPYVDSKEDNDYDNDYDRHLTIFCCNEDALDRHQDKPGIYRADIELDSYQYKISSVLPLKRAARDNFDCEQIVISNISNIENGISVEVIEKKAKLVLDQSQKGSIFSYRASEEGMYLLENTKRQEAFIAEHQEDYKYYGNVLSVTSRLSKKIVKLDFLYVNNRNSQLPKIDLQWLTDAQLIRVDTVLTGHLKKQIEVKDFILPAKSMDSEDEPVQ